METTREMNYRGVPLVRGDAEVGMRVAYEDMANPRREGVVTEVVDTTWTREYRVEWDDGGETQSGCRQYGWTVVYGDGEG